MVAVSSAANDRNAGRYAKNLVAQRDIASGQIDCSAVVVLAHADGGVDLRTGAVGQCDREPVRLSRMG